MVTVDVIADLPQFLQRVRCEVNLLTVLEADRIDKKMVVHTLNTMVIVSVQMCCYQHLITRKRLPGKFQADTVGFLTGLNFPRQKGLHILIEVSAAGFAVKIFGCHEFFIRVPTEAVDTADILPSVFVNGFLLLHAVADTAAHGTQCLFSDVLLYLDFKGIFDRDADNPKAAIMQKKTEAMFSPEGITLNFGQGDARYLAFERSGSMSRSAVLSFVRADIYEELSRRMTVGMTLGVCQLSKLYAYNGLLFSSGTRIETDMLWEKDAIVVIDNPTAVYPDVDIITVEDKTGIGDVRNYERVEKKSDVAVTLFDGEGILSPALAEEIDRLYCGKHIHTSFQIRMPYIKGMVHEVDFHGLFREATVTKITDLWGVEHPIERVRMILTKSQFKGCGWMTENGLTFEEYLKRLRAYRHTLYITGVNRTNSEPFA